MGHGKETPRQKMISIMYLFLTCMLALNVSKDVLDAFYLINEKMQMTNENFVSKNEIVYAALDKAAAENPAKAGEVNKLAMDVKRRAQVLVDTLQYFKEFVIATADGRIAGEQDYQTLLKFERNEKGQRCFINDNGEKVALEEEVSSKDNIDVGAQVMVGEGNNKHAKVTLHPMFDSLRIFATDTSIIKGLSQDKIESFNKLLSTADHEDPAGNHPWESQNFEHLPLLGVVANLTQMQNAVRNVEGDIISHLYSSLDAASFKFNKLTPVVIPNSNYIMSGSDYEAKIFLAAFDTTSPPTVVIGGQKVSVDPKDNMATYKVKATSIGEKKYDGVIKIKAPSSDDTLTYKFSSEYMVAQPSLVISPTKMNVFYIGVDNPVDISVPGVASANLIPSISSGSITKAANGYVVKVKQPGKTVISVSTKSNGGTKSMGSMEFRVKKVPDPVAKVAGQKGGNITASLLQAAKQVDAVMENFDFDLKFNISEFNVSTKTKDGYTIDKKSTSNKITSEQKALLSGLKKGQKVYFEEIKAKGPDGSIRDLGTVMFKVQ